MAGDDRFSTAAALADDVPDGIGVVYVTTGADYPDALGVGPVAGMELTALLLVTADAVPEATAAALDRLRPGRIVVVGGTDAVSPAVVASLAAYTDGPVERIAGTDRYATAAALSASAFPGNAETVYLASGESFADAIAAGQAAAASGGPVLPIRRDGIPPVILDELRRLRPDRVVIAGGTAAVSDEVEDALEAALPDATIERVAGADRYGTAVALAAAADVGIARSVVLASGEAFADALAATPTAVRTGTPLVLVPRAGTVPDAVTAFVRDLDPIELVVVGGTASISQAVVDQLG